MADDSGTNETKNRWMVCGVCGYPLERDVTGTMFGGLEWGHLDPDQRDHLVVPIDAADIEINARCDFCHAENASQLILATTFNTSAGSRSIGHWAACEICDVLIRRRRWSNLVTRVKTSGGPAAREFPRQGLLDLYARLEQHMYGQISLAEWKARAEYPLPTED